MFTRQKEDQAEKSWVESYTAEVKLPIKVIPVKDWTLTKALWYRLNKPLGWFGMSVIVIYFMSALLAFLSLWVWNEFIIK